MTADVEEYTMPADMRGRATGDLFDYLKVNRGKALHLIAAGVERLDTLTAQLFVIAQKTWAQDAVEFAVVHPSPKLTETLTRLGLQDAVPVREV